MKKVSLSIKIYFSLIITLAILAAINVFLPQGTFMSAEVLLPASKPVLALVNVMTVLVLYGGLGFLGLKLSPQLGFADIWDLKISNKQRFLVPAFIGAGLGVFLIIADLIFSNFHNLGSIPHPPFPTSIVASAAAAIGEEVIFRLFFISFWVWIVSHLIFKKRWQNQVFWIVTLFSAFLFAIGHFPSVMILFGINSFSELPYILIFEIILLNGVISFFAAFYFKQYGFLAAVGIHFWTDIVWHVIWGIIS